MSLQKKEELSAEIGSGTKSSKIFGNIFSKHYVVFLSEAGWKLEKKTSFKQL
tara:strand:- start:436 stop:591 length:156 start_codon:yes stop_codon:yes gene_type:complete